MKITEKWLSKHDACSEAIEWVKTQVAIPSDRVNGSNTAEIYKMKFWNESQSPLIGSMVQTPGNFLFFVSIGYSGKSVHLFKNCSRAIFRVPHTTSF